MKIFVAIPQNEDPGCVFHTFLTKTARTYLEERFEVCYNPYERELTAEEFREAVRDCDAVMTGWGSPRVTYDMLKDSKVKVLAHTGGSVGTVADSSLYENGIRVISGNPVYARSVAEGVIAYMLTGLRRIPYYINEVRGGGWHGENGFYSEGLLDRTVGIIGLGAISRYLIEMLKVFHVKVKIYSSHAIEPQYLAENDAEQVSLEEIFKTCQIVSLHSALTSKTEGMIGKEHFDLMQDGALFVNTARGAVVREEEMIEVLKTGRIRAVLDVYCKEPLEQDSPLRTLENVYCVPHMGGPTLDRRQVVTMRLADDLIHFENGEAMEMEVSAEAASRMTVEKKK